MFIIMLSKNLEKAGSHIHNAVGDADFLITQTVIAVARTSTSGTILVGDDTDLLILLCHHVPSDMTNVYFRPESWHMSRRSPRCWNIADLKLALGPEVCNSILFAHAILGCDSISRLYGLGKGMAIKLLCNNTHFQIAANVFSNPDATPANVIMAEENSIALLYNGCLGDRLDSLRLPRFYRKVGSSTAHVQPRIHPPTSAAAKFHSFRVYLQVQQLMGNDLEPESGVDSFKMARYSQHKHQLKKILPQQNSQILWDATAKQDVLQNSAVAENMVSSALQPVDSAGAHVLIPRVWMEMYNSCVLINNCAYLYIV